MSLPQVLLLDDDASVHRAVEFRLRGFAEVTACLHVEAAMEALRATPFDVALIDVNLGETASGIEAIGQLRGVDPHVSPVIFTAHTDYDTALDAFRVHAFDFVPKSLRQDEEFRTKLNRAIAHTRGRRALARRAAEALQLRQQLREAVIRNELEITSGDIQRGLLADSLQSFSALLGRVELMDFKLQQRLPAAPDLADLARLSGGAVEELHQYVDTLRDYFAAPERAAESVNRLLARAGEVVRDELPATTRVSIERLDPDHPVRAEGRAVLRAIVILVRLAAEGLPPGHLTVVPRTVADPAGWLSELRARPHARVLQSGHIRKEGRSGIAIEITAPVREADVDAVAALFALEAPRGPVTSAWSALAMLARAGAALAVENRREAEIRYTVLLAG